MTEQYMDFKRKVTSSSFPWYFQPSFQKIAVDRMAEEYSRDDFGIHNIFAHCLLERPEISGAPDPASPYYDNLQQMFKEFRDIKLLDRKSSMMRAALNLSTPYVSGPRYSIPHTDHEFDHTNLIIYLTDAGGKTFVEGESFDPEEDDMILFKGEHYNELPKLKNRIVLVATFLVW